jgi:hypothetical protein
MLGSSCNNFVAIIHSMHARHGLRKNTQKTFDANVTHARLDNFGKLELMHCQNVGKSALDIRYHIFQFVNLRSKVPIDAKNI